MKFRGVVGSLETSKMESLAIINGKNPLTIVAKLSSLDVSKGTGYAFEDNDYLTIFVQP